LDSSDNEQRFKVSVLRKKSWEGKKNWLLFKEKAWCFREFSNDSSKHGHSFIWKAHVSIKANISKFCDVRPSSKATPCLVFLVVFQ